MSRGHICMCMCVCVCVCGGGRGGGAGEGDLYSGCYLGYIFTYGGAYIWVACIQGYINGILQHKICAATQKIIQFSLYKKPSAN